MDIIQQIKISLRQSELPVIPSGDRINLLSWAAGLAKNIKLTLGVYNGILVYYVKTTQNYCTEQGQFSTYEYTELSLHILKKNYVTFLNHVCAKVSSIQINNLGGFLCGPPWKVLLHKMLLWGAILSLCPYASSAKLGEVYNVVEREEAYI
jgi:hypothetical protein